MEFPVYSWSGILLPERVEASPLVYIKPTKELIDYAGGVDFVLDVVVRETDSPYDGPQRAVLDTSLLVPDYRPNFYNKTGFYVLVLDRPWKGYPRKLGKVEVRQSAPHLVSLQNRMKKVDEVSSPAQVESYQTAKCPIQTAEGYKEASDIPSKPVIETSSGFSTAQLVTLSLSAVLAGAAASYILVPTK